jgi:small subunit ribosomal protein S6
MRSYELMTIHRPELGEDEIRALVAGIESFLAEQGAKVTSTDLWGKRRFSYEIKHVNEGFYSVIGFEGEPAAVDELDRMLSIADSVVRHKVVRPGG